VIKEKVLGKKYELSLTFIGDTRMRSLNQAYRKKDSTTDILSFPLSKTSGEIFISQKAADKKAKTFGMTSKEYLTFVFIHGLLHLEGRKHGRTMEKLEDSWCKKFGITVSKQ
jgi:probable rRNA maturation factor